MNYIKWFLLTGLVIISWISTSMAYSPVIDYSLNITTQSNGLGGDLTKITPYSFKRLDSDRTLGFGLLSISDYSDYYRKSSLEKSNASYQRSSINHFYVRNGGNIPWEISLFSEHSLMRIRGVDGTQLSLNDGKEAFGGSIKFQYGPIQFSSSYLTDNDEQLKGSLSLSSLYKNKYQVGICWKKEEDTTFLYGFNDEHEYYEEDYYDRYYANLKIKKDCETLTGYLDIKLYKLIGLQGIVNRHLWINRYNRFEDFDLYPTIYPWGNESDYHVFLNIGDTPVKTAFGFRGKSYDLKAYGYKGALYFSKVAKFKMDNHSEFATITISPEDSGVKFLLEAEKSDFESEVDGYLEFWPWSSGWADLFGYRRYVSSNIEADYWRYHVGFSNTFGNKLTLSCGFNFFDIYPDISWSDYSWGFWVNEERIDYYRIQAGIVSLGFEKSFERFSLSYEFNQAFPIRIWDENKSTQSTGDDGNEFKEVRKSSEYGGGFHRLTLGYIF